MKPFERCRRTVQLIFFLTALFIGFRFWQFTLQLDMGRIPVIERPPGVEAFLPISALLSLKQFLMTGVVNQVHPSGLMILGFITLAALLLKKSFCSWICPIGCLSEILGRVRALVFKREITLPPWADIPLRGIKYLGLTIFVWTIFFKMNLSAVEAFVYSSFNIISDIKMLRFFTDISFTSVLVISAIAGLTFVVQNFWCRYLCPYGAYLGLVSLLSPYKIRREPAGCTSCKKCTRACPGHIRVDRLDTVMSDECFACGKCIDACPEKGVLSLSLLGRRAAVRPWAAALALLLIFGAGSIGARWAGMWQNRVSAREYLSHMAVTGLIRPERIENMARFVAHLDQKGKIRFMMQMRKNRADRTKDAPGSFSGHGKGQGS